MRIKLIFKSVSQIAGIDEIGLLVLIDEQRSRQITVPIDKNMLYQFGLRMQLGRQSSDLLPEVLMQLVTTISEVPIEIFISDIRAGKYLAQLCFAEHSIPIRISDAVLLSYIDERIAIYIDEKLFMRQGVPYQENASGMAIPINVLSTEMLEKELEKAVESENYELASFLRDEINRRNA